MSTHNIVFYGELTKNIFQLSSNMHLICSYGDYEPYPKYEPLIPHMSLVVKKTAFCICENKDADQLCGNREADQRLGFRYMDSTIPLLYKYKISSL